MVIRDKRGAAVVEDKQVSAAEIAALRADIAELKDMVSKLISPAAHFTASEKAKILKEAQRSGDRKKLREAIRVINGGM